MINIPAELFINLMDKVNNSVCSDAARPILRKILIEVDEHNIKMVACDGYKMSMAAAKHKTIYMSEPFSIMIEPINKAVLKGINEVWISRDNDNGYIAGTGQYELKLIYIQAAEGYFDYKKVLQSNAYTEAFEISFNAEKMIKILRAYKSGRNNIVKLRFALDQEGKPSPARPIYLTDDSTDIHISNILLPIRT